MKTKLLALMLLAGGSMFAQTRFSHAGNAQADERDFRAPAYSSNSCYQVAGRNQQRNDNDRFENDHGRNDRSRSSDRDDVRGYAQNYRLESRVGNRFYCR